MSPTSFDGETLSHLPGTAAIGHVRYSTAGESKLSNAQPILIDCNHGQIALCHNGNLVNARELQRRSRASGIDLPVEQRHGSTSCTSTRARKRRHVEDAIVESVKQVHGAFSLALLTRDRLVAVRDPHGFRPLALGRLGDAVVIASETCAMDLIGATYVRDVEPGEVLVVTAEGMRSIKTIPAGAAARIASSSTCTSHGPTATCSARASTKCAPISAGIWRESSRSMPTSSCLSRTRAYARRSATPMNRVFRSAWA